MRSKNIDLGLLLLGVLLILVSSYQLFFREQLASDSRTVGTLSQTNAVVKTKSAVTLDWQDAFMGNAVAENQLIYTDQRSSAEVAFLHGDTLSIGENSLIKISSVENETSLDLERGIIRAKLEGKSPMVVEMNGQEFELSGNGAEVQINLKDKKGEIGVLAGDVTVQREGQKEKINPSVALAIDGAEMKTAEVYFRTVAPARDSTIYDPGETVPVRFAWEPEEEARVIISSGPNLENARTIGREALLGPGLYYWRVEGAKGRSLIGSFRVHQETAPKIIRPSHGSHLVLQSDGTGQGELLLQWEGEQRFDYKVEWTSAGGTISQTGRGPSSLVKVKEGGPLRWRVKIESENRPQAQWTEWQELSLDLVPPPAVPQDLSPHKVEYQTYRREGEKVEMSWSSPHLVEWEFEHPGGKTEAEIIEAKAHTVLVQEGGKYRWRVRAQDQFGRQGQWSDWKEFAVTDLSGQEAASGVQRVQLKRPDQMVSFEWDGEEGAETRFELARDPEFKEIVSRREVSSSSAKVAVPEVGTYYWRSRQFLPDGTVSSSEPVKVIIEPAPAPAKPEKLPDVEVPIEWQMIEGKSTWSPFDIFISSAVADELKGVVKVELPKSEDAKAYHLRIFRDAGLKDLVLEKTISGNTFEWIGAGPGTYYWQYAIIDFWDRQSPYSDPAMLTATGTEPRAPERARLRFPIRAVEIEEKELRFDWTRSSGAVAYRLEVSQDKNFKDVLLAAKTKKDSYKNKKWKLSPGLHYWRVLAADKLGQETVSNTGRFVIRPPLEKTIIADQFGAWKKEWRPRVSLAWSPSMDGYEFEQEDQKGEIDGNALMGLELKGTLFKDKWIFNAEVLRQSGEVFEGQDYLFQRLLIDGSKSWSFGQTLLSVGLALGQCSGQEYSIENDEVTGSSVSGLAYGPVIRAYYPMSPEWELQGRLQYLLGEIKQTELSGEALRSWGSEMFFLGGLGIATREYETNSGSQTSLRLSLGVGKEF